jgi:hypothetical protein
MLSERTTLSDYKLLLANGFVGRHWVIAYNSFARSPIGTPQKTKLSAYIIPQYGEAGKMSHCLVLKVLLNDRIISSSP